MQVSDNTKENKTYALCELDEGTVFVLPDSDSHYVLLSKSPLASLYGRSIEEYSVWELNTKKVFIVATNSSVAVISTNLTITYE